MEASAPAPSLKKSYSRRVSFKEDTITSAKESRKIDIESRLPDGHRPHSTCFWLSIAIGFVVFLMFLIGAISYGFFQSHLPAVRILRLNVGEIEVVATNNDAVMRVTANLAVFLEASNGKENTELRYRKMNASVVASGVHFGEVGLLDVRQPPKNSTTLVVAAGVKDAVMDDRSARDLRIHAEAHVLMIDVSVKGRMDMKVKGWKRSDSTFTVECRSINQSEIDAGRAATCTTQFY